MNIYAKILFSFAAIVVVVGLLIFFLPTRLSGVFRTQNYVMPSTIKRGWITIEYENLSCPEIPSGIFSQDIEIPPSGFLCASSSLYSGWHSPKYLVVDEAGTKTEIPAKEIMARSTFRRAMETIPNGEERCSWEGEEFFFGHRSEFVEENPILQNELFLAHHPDCREKSSGR